MKLKLIDDLWILSNINQRYWGKTEDSARLKYFLSNIIMSRNSSRHFLSPRLLNGKLKRSFSFLNFNSIFRPKFLRAWIYMHEFSSFSKWGFNVCVNRQKLSNSFVLFHWIAVFLGFYSTSFLIRLYTERFIH